MAKVEGKAPKRNRNEAAFLRSKTKSDKSKSTDTQSNGSTEGITSEPTDSGSLGGGGKIKNLSLSSIRATRKTTARLMKQYLKGNLSGEQLQKILYGITILLQGFKAEINQDLEARIEALEAYQNEQH